MNLISLLPVTKTQLDLLFEIYASREDYLRNIEKKTKINPSLLHRLLKKLVAAKAIISEKKGKEVYYTLSSEGKIFWEKVLEQYHRDKIISANDRLRILSALLVENKDLWGECRKIYLFGSFASGSSTSRSDIDLLFVGEDKDKILRWCKEASVIVQREINPLIYSSLKFKQDLKKREAFLTSVITNANNRIILK